MSHRIHQINSLIKTTLGPILFESLDQEKFGLITIKHVDTVVNLDSTKVWVSVVKNSQDLLSALQNKIYDIQQELNHKLSLHRVPKIIFKLDESNLYVEKIDTLLKKIT